MPSTENFKEGMEGICLCIGTFKDAMQDEKWKKIKTFKTRKEGYIAFKDLCKKVAAYSYEELMDIYSAPRVDIELLSDGRILKWMGIYEKQMLDDEEEEIEEEEK